MSNLLTTTDLRDGIIQVTLNDPAHENCLTPRLCAELGAVLQELREAADLKVLILAGRPDVFCGGGTLEMLQDVISGKTDAKDLLLPRQIISFPVPVIGALEGHAVGAGLMLALCCDIVVAAEGRRYGANFTSLGFTPGMGTTFLLPALVGHQLASEMMYTAKLYKGRELRERGLFAHVVPGPVVASTAVSLARRIADKPRHVLEMLKDGMSLPRRRGVEDAMSREHLMHKVSFMKPEVASMLLENFKNPLNSQESE